MNLQNKKSGTLLGLLSTPHSFLASSMPTMQPAFANRSSVVPPDTRLAATSQPPAAQIPSPTDQFPSFKESDFIGIGGNLLQTPTWLQSDGQVNYVKMTQHLLQAKRYLQVSLFGCKHQFFLVCDEYGPLQNHRTISQ